jgi:hypothetical protein
MIRRTFLKGFLGLLATLATPFVASAARWRTYRAMPQDHYVGNPVQYKHLFANRAFTPKDAVELRRLAIDGPNIYMHCSFTNVSAFSGQGDKFCFCVFQGPQAAVICVNGPEDYALNTSNAGVVLPGAGFPLRSFAGASKVV